MCRGLSLATTAAKSAPRRRQRCRRRRRSSQRFQIAKIRHKISSLNASFPSRFLQIYIYFRFRTVEFYTQNLSKCCRHKFRQYQEYFGLISGRFWHLAPPQLRPSKQVLWTLESAASPASWIDLSSFYRGSSQYTSDMFYKQQLLLKILGNM